MLRERGNGLTALINGVTTWGSKVPYAPVWTYTGLLGGAAETFAKDISDAVATSTKQLTVDWAKQN